MPPRKEEDLGIQRVTEVPSGTRTWRQKLMSAAKAVQLDVTDSWDDARLEREIRIKSGTLPKHQRLG